MIRPYLLLLLPALLGAASAACGGGNGSDGDADTAETTDPVTDGDGQDPAGRSVRRP